MVFVGFLYAKKFVRSKQNKSVRETCHSSNEKLGIIYDPTLCLRCLKDIKEHKSYYRRDNVHKNNTINEHKLDITSHRLAKFSNKVRKFYYTVFNKLPEFIYLDAGLEEFQRKFKKWLKSKTFNLR